ncbi:MAG: hypothetical protein OEU92_21805 [Alphaproteobacteria bacterium]|nr:hypothetical protein [Alphaproteobacteria bacterium]
MDQSGIVGERDERKINAPVGKRADLARAYPRQTASDPAHVPAHFGTGCNAGSKLIMHQLDTPIPTFDQRIPDPGDDEVGRSDAAALEGAAGSMVGGG